MLYRTVDSLNIPWDLAALSASSVLSLRLSAVWRPSQLRPPPSRPGLARLIVSDLFIYDHFLGYIRRRSEQDGIYYRRLSRLFFADVESGSVHFRLFFPDFAYYPPKPEAPLNEH